MLTAATFEGWLRLAQSRQVLGETDRARATFQKALELHPDEPLLLKGYAEVLVGPPRSDTGLPEVGDQANELLTRAVGLQPEDPEVWWYLGIESIRLLRSMSLEVSDLLSDLNEVARSRFINSAFTRHDLSFSL